MEILKIRNEATLSCYLATVPESFSEVKPGELWAVKLHMQVPVLSVLTSPILAHTVTATLRRLLEGCSDGEPHTAALISEESHPKENVWKVHLLPKNLATWMWLHHYHKAQSSGLF